MRKGHQLCPENHKYRAGLQLPPYAFNAHRAVYKLFQYYRLSSHPFQVFESESKRGGYSQSGEDAAGTGLTGTAKTTTALTAAYATIRAYRALVASASAYAAESNCQLHLI